MTKCLLCPRGCGADRHKGNTGACHMTEKLKVARAALHMWEEPCISGENGSGAVFFSGCQLSCVFCQNGNISDGKTGKLITVERLTDIFFELKEKGAANINLVTPDHYAPQIIEAIKAARKRNLGLPFVYNCSGYVTVDTLKMLDGYVDIYLTDFKYMSGNLAAKYSHAPDYPQVAMDALAEMVRQTGGNKTAFDERGMMQKGVIVRHLQLPGQITDSKRIIDYLYTTFGDDIYISIMNQYTPMGNIGETFPELAASVSEEEYEELVDYAVDIGVENGFIQEGGTVGESFIPEFDGDGV